MLEILRLAGDEIATTGAISKVVESDPALAGRMLKLVNSPLAGMARKIGSISEAVALLGLRTVRNLALGLSLVSDNRRGSCKGFDYEAFWSESLARAVAARRIAATLKTFPPDEAFAAGLLGKVGRLALATVRPEEYTRVLLATAGGDASAMIRLEQEAFGIDHNALSAEMMADWCLEAILCEAVGAQDLPDRAGLEPGSQGGRLTRLLRLAGAAAAVLVRGEASLDCLAALAHQANALGIPGDAFDLLFEAIKGEWREAGAIFSVSTSDVSSLETLRAGARITSAPKDDQRTQASAPAPEPQRPVDGLRILVVDDDPAMLRLLEKYLTEAGCRVTTATNGIEALEADRREAPQMVITDWMMPEMNGLDFCRRLRVDEENGFVYLLLLTAQSEKARAVEALEAGADDFLAKPFSREELLAHVHAGARIVRLEARLADRDRKIAGVNARLADTNNQLRIMATTDVLTGLTNRREGLARLAEHWSLANRHREPLSCIIADIDHFKRFNDTCGHAVGDAILKATAATLLRIARAGEVVCRLGGEEFLIICPKSPAASAAAGAERMRLAIAASAGKPDRNERSVTISLGVAERTTSMAGPDELLKAADDMLYAAKEGGRNRVCVAGGSHESAQVKSSPGEKAKTRRRVPVADLGCRPARVLVVDDDALSRALCRRLLESEGCIVSEAVDGLDALDQIPACAPDVVVLDVMMPRLDGLECARRLKANAATREIPIIMLSAAGEASAIEAGLEAGADEYVTKPLNHREFALRVRSMVRLHHGKTELLWSNETRWEQARAMHVLLDFSCGLVGEKHIDRVLKRIVSAASDLTRSRRVSIMLPDAEGRYLTIAHSIGIDDRTAAEVLVPVGEAIAGKVFLSGEQVVVNSPAEAGTDHTSYDSRFFASVPLVSKALRTTDRVLGVLNTTDRCDRQPFTAGELESLDLLCNIAATAINDLMSRQARDRAQDGIVVALATLAECRDADTGTHLDRVTRYAVILADELRNRDPLQEVIDEGFLDALRLAMPLHDIGKVGVPDSILLKPGRLTKSEMEQMRLHAEIGARTIRSVRERTPDAAFLRFAEEIAWGHHERWDGAGYPQGKREHDIPLSARIAAVADVYDALTSKRVYKEAISHDQAARIIRAGAATQFDPGVVEAFVRRQADFARIATEQADTSAADKPVEVLAAG